MRVSWKKRTKGGIEYGLVFGAMALLALLAARMLPVFSLFPACIVKSIGNFPCPTCGSSHALMYLSQGEIANSFWANPLVCLAVVGALLFFLCNIVTLAFDLPGLDIKLTEKEKNAVFILAGSAVALNWLYLLVSHGHL